jgi:hypothetical protein
MRYSIRTLAAVIVAFAFSSPASAWTVDLNHAITTTYAAPLNLASFILDPFAVTGTVVYQDDFGGSVPDSNEYASGSGSYVTGATRGSMSENGGVVTMDVSNSAVGTSGLSGNQRRMARLRPRNSYGTSQLYQGAVFSTAAAYSIATPDERGRYGVRLHTGSPTGDPQIDFAEIAVRTRQGNTKIVFRKWVGNDYTVSPVGGWSTIDSATLSVPTGATDIVLGLIKPFDTDDTGTVGINESKQVFAAYAFYDSVSDSLFGTTLLSGSTGLFHGENWTQMETFATQVVPEPGTWLLMGIGLISLLVTSRRRLS